jgi:hypothetical protein
MTRVLLYLSIGLLICCAPQNKITETVDTLSTVQQAVNKGSTANTDANPEEGDCVFNDDYKGLTSDWLAELKIKNFIWRDDLKQALVSKGQDTVFMAIVQSIAGMATTLIPTIFQGFVTIRCICQRF